MATATAMLRRKRNEQLRQLADLCLANAEALSQAVEWCASHGIGAFRVNSQILPLKTHPQVGYEIEHLPLGDRIEARFRAAGDLARRRGLRLSFHPDQFVLLNSPRPEVRDSSIAEIEYQTRVAEWIGADVINVHGGGVYGDKVASLERLQRNLSRLSDAARSRLTLENDDRAYAPSDLLPLCRAERIPFCYDAHHHRCLPDDLTLSVATEAAIATWNREPLFHLSSPRSDWGSDDPRPHADYIRPSDFPSEWHGLTATVEVEAKAKEPAVLRLRASLVSAGVAVWPGDSLQRREGEWQRA